MTGAPGAATCPRAGETDTSAPVETGLLGRTASLPTEPSHPALEAFHPAVARWFSRALGAPTSCQRAAWPSIAAGENLLLAAPTGSGKTLAAFLSALDALVREGVARGLPAETRVLYVSPLRALGNDIRKNLEQPLMGIRDELFLGGHPDVAIRTAVRTGDTPVAARALMRRLPPHVLVTTPESLYILLTSESGREGLRSVRTVIVDEIHALAGSKRGAHLALSLERLEQLTGPGLVRVGLSATQKPLEAVARFLCGGEQAAPRPCRVLDLGHGRERDVSIELPPSPLAAVMSHEQWGEVYDRLAELVLEHRTTLVFANTRRLTERLAFHLSERLGEERVGAHHGSLSREQRLAAEGKLKEGALRVLVATSSLELGIDIGEVDLVCQVGIPRAIGTFLQRVGRAGRRVDRPSKGRLFPLSRDELVEAVALLAAVRAGELDALELPRAPLDVLAQQLVAAVACEEWGERDLFELVRRAWPYRELAWERFLEVVRMLAEGYTHRRARGGAHLFRDAVHGRLRARAGARLTAILNGGAIPDAALYEVREEAGGLLLGTLDEHFAIDSSIGDVFQLGNTSWRIARVETGTVWVQDAHGEPPSIPFWFGEAPARTPEFSAAVSAFRAGLERRLFPADAEESPPGPLAPDRAGARAWLLETHGLAPEAADQVLDYLLAARLALGALPTLETLVMERFFDAAGGQQLVIHTSHGGRVNRAWGLALRKRFCRTFNFELQAAATEEAIVLSLGETHSFALESVWRYLQAETVRPLLVQALLDAPMFASRWRWNACCALAIARVRGGRKVAPRLLRMQAEDLVAVVFPDQRACLETIQGDREVPDHPLVTQTIEDCLTEAMAIDTLEALLAEVAAGRKRLVARDLTEPSPLAAEILAARPYAFLDDAPLEERRTAAVQGRRWLAPGQAEELGRLDPEAIEQVRAQAWPEPSSAEEAHDALLLVGLLTQGEAEAACVPWTPLLEALARAGRALRVRPVGVHEALWVAVERLPELTAAVEFAEEVVAQVPAEYAAREWSRAEALTELLRSRLGALGVVSARALGAPLGLDAAECGSVLAALEGEGYAMRGRHTPGGAEEEWCERRLLARIHRQTVQRLRREIEPVSIAEYLRFLVGWQGLAGTAREGPGALERALEKLEGFEAPAGAWESVLLPARVEGYAPEALDALCLAGRLAWLKLRRGAIGLQAVPVRSTPVSLVSRAALPAWLGEERLPSGGLGPAAAAVAAALERHGASFLPELQRASGLPPGAIEGGLAELVVRGLVTADSFAGLRALLTPAERRARGPFAGLDAAGRWSLLAPVAATPPEREQALATIAQALLRRWGVLFRRLLEREPSAPPWGLLLRELRRLETRGQVRGGRFIAGQSGEQYALPEAVSALRESRRAAAHSAPTWVGVSACDPLNLTGVLLPAERVPAVSGHRLALRDGLPVASLAAGRLSLLIEIDAQGREQVERLFGERPVPPPAVRRYLPGASGAFRRGRGLPGRR